MEVTLVDTMPSNNLEDAIVQSARISYGNGTKTINEDIGLIRYLMRHWHTTPFEMVEFKFIIKCPIFVARQHMRHRTASINEYSARYSIVKEEFWIPVHFRTQGNVNKQGSGEIFDNKVLLDDYLDACQHSVSTYKKLLACGVSREIARAVLPQSTFTEFYWKINLHNLLHYLRLRLAPEAQEEIREIAELIYAHVRHLVPNVAQAFEDFRIKSITFTGPEIAGDVLSSGENREYENKKVLCSNILLV
jgi:thymidylate synthase (FAD)